MTDDRHIQDVLNAYSIIPHSISMITERVHKASDRNRDYAVKRSHLTHDTLTSWQHVYDLAYTHRLRQVLPVYVTTNGHLFYEAQDAIYYVTPWIEEKDISEEEIIYSLFHMFGHLHETTKRTADVDVKPAQASFSEYEHVLKEHHNRLLRHIALFEQQHFMSPFELQVCTQFASIDSVFNRLYDKLRTFNARLETDAAQTVSLCHGQLKREHFIYQHQGFLINWEQAGYGHPMQDVASLLKQTGRVHRIDESFWTEGMRQYFNHYHETQNDRLLLTLYLLDPLPCIQLIDHYVTHNESGSTLEMTQLMEQEVRRLNFALTITEALDDNNFLSDQDQINA